jgi:hypothetical protein
LGNRHPTAERKCGKVGRLKPPFLVEIDLQPPIRLVKKVEMRLFAEASSDDHLRIEA